MLVFWNDLESLSPVIMLMFLACMFYRQTTVLFPFVYAPLSLGCIHILLKKPGQRSFHYMMKPIVFLSHWEAAVQSVQVESCGLSLEEERNVVHLTVICLLWEALSTWLQQSSFLPLQQLFCLNSNRRTGDKSFLAVRACCIFECRGFREYYAYRTYTVFFLALSGIYQVQVTAMCSWTKLL